jgi:hypothetical protein
VKLWAPESGEQLSNYADDLELRVRRERIRANQLLYMTPLRETPSDDRARSVTWQDLANRCSRWLDELGDQAGVEMEWLVRPYLDYLQPTRG